MAECPPSEDEKREWIQQQVDALAEMEDGLMREANEQTESGEVQTEEIDREAEQEEIAFGHPDGDDNVSMLTPMRYESDGEEAAEEGAKLQPKQ